MVDSDVTLRQLSVYLDGELSEGEARKVADALEASEALRQELAELRAVRQLLMTLPRYRGGDELTARIVAAAEHLPQRQTLSPASRLTLWVRRLSWAAVLVIALAAGVLATVSWLSGPNPVPPTGTPIVVHHAAEDDRVKALSPAPVLAGGGKRRDAPEIADGKHEADNEVIFTHDLDLARRDVERAMLTNGLRGEPLPMRVRNGKTGDKERMRRDETSNFRFRRLGAEAVSYDVVGTDEQVTNLLADLGRIRGRQFVEQAVGWKAKASSARPAPKPPARAVNVTPQPITGKGAPVPGAPAKAPAPAPARYGKQGGAGGGRGAAAEEKKNDTIEPSLAGGVQQIVQAAELLFDMHSDRPSPGRGGQADSPQQTEGLTGPGADRTQQKFAQGQAPGGAGVQSAPRVRQARPSGEAGAVQGRRATMRRLVITLNRSPLTGEAEARRNAAMRRAAESAKE